MKLNYPRIPKTTTTIVLVCAFLAMLTGCGWWPPVVDSGDELRRMDLAALPESALRVRGLPEEDITDLTYVADVERLDFSSGWASYESRISNAGLKALSEVPFTRLSNLSLGYCDGITDPGLAHLVEMKTVRWLSLMACENITDEGLHNLKPMTTLNGLDLRGCPKITDSGLAYLAHMTNLKSVWLGGCPNVTSRGVKALQNALPTCSVVKDEKEWSYHQQ